MLEYNEWLEQAFGARKTILLVKETEGGRTAASVARQYRVGPHWVKSLVRKSHEGYQKYQLWCGLHQEAGLPPPPPLLPWGR